MGGSSSTQRNVTIQEDDSPGMVKVSETVARRLLGQPELTADDKDDRQPTGTVSNDEMAKLQNYYKKKLLALERKNRDLYQTTTEQFAKAVEEVEEKFIKTTASPICEDLQQAVLKCYQENPKYTLNCSPQVLAFTQCVQKQREKILTTVNRKGS